MPRQLISYIAPAAPATRRPAEGDEPFMRPEIGFTPKWYREALGIDFGERWHADPAYRRETVIAMRGELKRRFPGTRIGSIHRPDRPLDLLTGVFGGSFVAAIYGVPIIYAADNWPNCAHKYLSDDQMKTVEPPDLDTNGFFQEYMEQVEWIAGSEGRVEGFVNPQGILNNAQRIRGEMIFLDMMEDSEGVRRLFNAVCETMIGVVRRLHARQKESGFEPGFFTVSNCLVNMVSAKHYEELLLPYELRLQKEFGVLGIHNCAWNASPYLNAYAQVPDVAYLDMGHDSDMERAKDLFPDTRRAIMYTPMDAANKSEAEIRADFENIARKYAPCDMVLADIEAGTPDARVKYLVDLCAEITERAGKGEF